MLGMIIVSRLLPCYTRGRKSCLDIMADDGLCTCCSVLTANGLQTKACRGKACRYRSIVCTVLFAHEENGAVWRAFKRTEEPELVVGHYPVPCLLMLLDCLQKIQKVTRINE